MEKISYNDMAARIEEAVIQNLNNNASFLEFMYDALYGEKATWNEDKKLFEIEDSED